MWFQELGSCDVNAPGRGTFDELPPIRFVLSVEVQLQRMGACCTNLVTLLGVSLTSIDFVASGYGLKLGLRRREERDVSVVAEMRDTA